MALVLCPECGEETLDQLVNCPICANPLDSVQNSTGRKNDLSLLFGAVFVGGILSATICNMMGFTRWSIGLGVVGIAGLALFVLRLNAER